MRRELWRGVLTRSYPARIDRRQALWTLPALILGMLAHDEARAQESAPTEPLLVIEGSPSTGDRITLDRAALERLESRSITTSTIWTEGVHVFAGPVLLDVLASAGASGGTVSLCALNNYCVEMPVAELSETAPIVAMLIDGQPFPVRDKGPLWVIYPYDSGPEFQTEVTYSRSIWQLASIKVLPD